MKKNIPLSADSEELLKLAAIHCERTGLMRSTVATKIVNKGGFFDRLESGGGMTTKTYHKVRAWFLAHTPAESPSQSNASAPAVHSNRSGVSE